MQGDLRARQRESGVYIRPTHARVRFGEAEPERNGHIAEREDDGHLRAPLALAHRSPGDRLLEGGHQRVKGKPARNAEQSHRVLEREPAVEIFIGKEHLSAVYVDKDVERPDGKLHRSRVCAAHMQERRPAHRFLADLCLYRKGGAVADEHGAEPFRKIIGSGALRFRRACFVGLCVSDEIFFVIGNVRIGFVVRIGDHRFAGGFRLDDALRGGVLLGDAHLGDAPVFRVTQRHVHIFKRRAGAQPAHRDHLIPVIMRGLHGVEGERKDVFLPFPDDLFKGEDGILLHDIVGKLRAPQPVTRRILFAGKDLRRFARIPFRLAPRPIGGVGGYGAADDRLVRAEKFLHGDGRRSAQPFAAAERGGDQHAVFIIFSALDILIDRDAERVRRHLGGGIGMIIPARHQPADDIAEVFQLRVIFGQRPVVRRIQPIAHAFGGLFFKRLRRPSSAARKKDGNARYDHAQEHRQKNYPFFLPRKFFHILSSPITLR